MNIIFSIILVWTIGLTFIFLRRWILAMPPEPSHDTRDVSLEEIMGALPSITPALGRGSGRPQINMSDVYSIVSRYVQETSPASSVGQKIQLVEALIARVKATGVYDFVD